MRFLLFTTLIMWAATAQAAGLTKIERRLIKEPVYQAKPKYCLLVFGPEAKTKVWLVIDGDTLYVDRNGNGDITEKDERIDMPRFEKPPISSLLAGQRTVKAGNIQDGHLLHTGLEITQLHLDLDYKPKGPEEQAFKRAAESIGGILHMVGLTVEMRSGRGKLAFIAGADSQGVLTFTDRLENASLIQFDGPLQMGLQPFQKMVRGDKPSELHCSVGTQGMGAGTFPALLYVSKPGFVPKECHPIAEIEFPGESTVRTKVTLDRRC